MEYFNPRRLPLGPAPAAPPREIAFLAAYGAPPELLIEAAAIAASAGVCADQALLGEGLAQEEFFYRALAHRIGAPFHVGGAPLDYTASPARALGAGIVYLAHVDAPYRAIIAPRGPALRMLINAADEGLPISGLAITSPRRLGALVRVERAAEIARRAAHGLERLDPAFCARGELYAAQTLSVAAFGLGMIALAYTAPWAERAASSALLWALFSTTILLRISCCMAADSQRATADIADVDLPVYTVIVAMYREGAVLQKLVAGLNGLDYPVLGSKLT